jgi:uncharacterized FlgJ-related protein
MIYKYDSKGLTYTKINLQRLVGIVLFFVITLPLISFQIGKKEGLEQNVIELPVEDRWHLIQETRKDTFSVENLTKMLKDLNVRFPHIVMAQAMIESGHFQSNIFRSNHNLFGMKQARARCTTAKGTELGHAYYHNWKESVYDYAFFQSRYLNDLRTEQAYLDYLDRNYAEAPEYDKAILRVIEHQNLRELFSK